MSNIIIPGHAPRFHIPSGVTQSVNEKLANTLQQVTLINAGKMKFDKVQAAAILFDLAVELLKKNNMNQAAIKEMVFAAISWQHDEFGGNRQ
jgi:hypothetical protein